MKTKAACALLLASSACLAQSGRFHPEDIIKYPNSAPACVTADDLKEVLLRSLRGEQTKTRAMPNRARIWFPKRTRPRSKSPFAPAPR